MHAFSKNLGIVDTAKQCSYMYHLRSLIINTRTQLWLIADEREIMTRSGWGSQGKPEEAEG